MARYMQPGIPSFARSDTTAVLMLLEWSLFLLTLFGIDQLRYKLLGFGYRAKYIVQSAKLMQEGGGVDWALSMRSKGRDAVRDQLMTLSGVGPKASINRILLHVITKTFGSTDCHSRLLRATGCLYTPSPVLLLCQYQVYRKRGLLPFFFCLAKGQLRMVNHAT